MLAISHTFPLTRQAMHYLLYGFYNNLLFPSGSCQGYWARVNTEERRKLLITMLDFVCSDTKQTKSVVAVRPKPLFRPIFRVAALREGSDIRVVN